MTVSEILVEFSFFATCRAFLFPHTLFPFVCIYSDWLMGTSYCVYDRKVELTDPGRTPC